MREEKEEGESVRKEYDWLEKTKGKSVREQEKEEGGSVRK